MGKKIVDIEIYWKEKLRNMEFIDLLWLRDNKVFSREENEVLKMVNNLLLARIEQLKASI